eukprot:TRINITY_DN59655_c0_g1_i1.p1 TRINITY_DN59655_c0_g1~~TRINITY_DN59655_c0_g1_i1.p1  ORF type:complete len:626 (+),score=35.09 TRINITY_DN59655_c0_g1_i1:34-1911(+)
MIHADRPCCFFLLNACRYGIDCKYTHFDDGGPCSFGAYCSVLDHRMRAQNAFMDQNYPFFCATMHADTLPGASWSLMARSRTFGSTHTRETPVWRTQNFGTSPELEVNRTGQPLVPAWWDSPPNFEREGRAGPARRQLQSYHHHKQPYSHQRRHRIRTKALCMQQFDSIVLKRHEVNAQVLGAGSSAEQPLEVFDAPIRPLGRTTTEPDVTEELVISDTEDDPENDPDVLLCFPNIAQSGLEKRRHMIRRARLQRGVTTTLSSNTSNLFPTTSLFTPTPTTTTTNTSTASSTRQSNPRHNHSGRHRTASELYDTTPTSSSYNHAYNTHNNYHYDSQQPHRSNLQWDSQDDRNRWEWKPTHTTTTTKKQRVDHHHHTGSGYNHGFNEGYQRGLQMAMQSNHPHTTADAYNSGHHLPASRSSWSWNHRDEPRAHHHHAPQNLVGPSSFYHTSSSSSSSYQRQNFQRTTTPNTNPEMNPHPMRHITPQRGRVSPHTHTIHDGESDSRPSSTGRQRHSTSTRATYDSEPKAESDTVKREEIFEEKVQPAFLVIQNLAADTTEDELGYFLQEEYGPNRTTMQGAGTAEIYFADKTHAIRAKHNLHMQRLGGSAPLICFIKYKPLMMRRGR